MITANQDRVPSIDGSRDIKDRILDGLLWRHGQSSVKVDEYTVLASYLRTDDRFFCCLI